MDDLIGSEVCFGEESVTPGRSDSHERVDVLPQAFNTHSAMVVVSTVMFLRRGDILPEPTEEEASKLFENNKNFALGCMFAQVVIDAFLLGIFTMQLFSYWRWQRRDRWWTKCVVIGTSVLAYAISAYIMWFISHLFVENFGLYKTFLRTTYLSWFPLLDSFVSGFVQGFFTYRAWRLNNRALWIPVVLVALMLTAIGSSLATKIIFARLNSELDAPRVRVPMLIWLASIMTADIIITATILRGLLKTRTGWAHTDKVIARLIRMTFESQMPPTILAIIFMGSFIATPASLLGSTLQGIQSKYYCIGLMYSLNSRVDFKPKNVTIGNTDGADAWGINRHTATTIQVDVQTEVWEERVGPDKSYSRQPYSLNRGRIDEEASIPEASSHTDSTAGKTDDKPDLEMKRSRSTDSLDAEAAPELSKEYKLEKNDEN